MEWHDAGIVLASRKHGESSIILTLLTEQHGRHLGLVRGGAGRRARGIYEPGNLLSACWRARIPDHLGGYTCELSQPRAALLLDDPLRLTGLSAACALADATLPERVRETVVFQDFTKLLDAIEHGEWLAAYVIWEVHLLRELGFGLDLSHCAATGQTDDLIYVSPRTGRAVSREAGRPYAKDLLALPTFLAGSDEAAGPTKPIAILEGLALTGYFLERHVLAPQNRKLPAARRRLVERIRALAM